MRRFTSQHHLASHVSQLILERIESGDQWHRRRCDVKTPARSNRLSLGSAKAILAGTFGQWVDPAPMCGVLSPFARLQRLDQVLTSRVEVSPNHLCGSLPVPLTNA